MKERFRSVWRGREVVNILGVMIDPVTIDSAAETVITWAAERSGRARAVFVTGVHGVMEAYRSGHVRNVLNTAHRNVPDGMPVVWIGRYAGFSSMRRVFGPDLMLEVCRRSVSRHLSHFFLGGRPGAATALAHSLTAKFPGLRVAGTYTPPFRPLAQEEVQGVLETIRRTSPDLVWIGLSTPNQELLSAALLPEIPTGVVLTVGAAFDYNTGRLHRAPHWMQVAGLEWSFRLLQEPRRLFGRYMRNNPSFLLLALLQMMGRRGSPVDPAGDER